MKIAMLSPGRKFMGSILPSIDWAGRLPLTFRAGIAQVHVARARYCSSVREAIRASAAAARACDAARAASRASTSQRAVPVMGPGANQIRPLTAIANRDGPSRLCYWASARPRRPPGPHRVAPLDPLQQVAQLRCVDGYRSARRRRPGEPAPFQTLAGLTLVWSWHARPPSATVTGPARRSQPTLGRDRADAGPDPSQTDRGPAPQTCHRTP